MPCFPRAEGTYGYQVQLPSPGARTVPSVSNKVGPIFGAAFGASQDPDEFPRRPSIHGRGGFPGGVEGVEMTVSSAGRLGPVPTRLKTFWFGHWCGGVVVVPWRFSAGERHPCDPRCSIYSGFASQ